ncbi:MAG TPA: CHAT domain-containing protein [Thermoanaerobaculia bacterium]|nr:CHAT domain-containing protein [Thermoanaerobaculia bacterium]
MIDDASEWREILSLSLAAIPGLEIQTASSVDEAWKALLLHEYDLVTVDISLVAIVTPSAVINRGGFEILQRLRSEQASVDPALFVVSVHADMKHVMEAFDEYSVDAFFDKTGFPREAFVARARKAILASLVRTAERRVRRRCGVTISMSNDRFVSAELTGPVRKGSYYLDAAFDGAGFAARADALNLRIEKGTSRVWPDEARTIGRELYQTLMKQPNLAEVLIRGGDFTSRQDPTVIQFTGNAPALGVPFELLTDGSDYLCFEQIIVRRLATDGLRPTQKGEPFHEFVATLAQTRQPLRVLLIAANTDGKIPHVDRELAEVRSHLENALKALGIEPLIHDVRGKDATYENCRKLLQSGRYHIVHYAGHGEYDKHSPESSGIVLTTGARTRSLTAAQLKLLVGGSDLRLAFFSCCVSAATAQQVGKGDFHGTLDGVVRGDVPITIGYRWNVSDLGARTFAQTFYKELFASLSPGMALLRSRRAAADHAGGRQKPLWASAVMVCQTEP